MGHQRVDGVHRFPLVIRFRDQIVEVWCDLTRGLTLAAEDPFCFWYLAREVFGEENGFATQLGTNNPRVLRLPRVQVIHAAHDVGGELACTILGHHGEAQQRGGVEDSGTSIMEDQLNRGASSAASSLVTPFRNEWSVPRSQNSVTMMMLN